jgi:hypothetical protein
LPAALAFLHLARAIAANLAFPAPLERRTAFWAALGAPAAPLDLAHRAHLAFVAAIMAALPAALKCRLALFAGLEAISAVPLTLAHLARAAAAIFARWDADMVLRPAGAEATGVGISPPEISLSSRSRDSIRSLMTMACLSWLMLSFDIVLISKGSIGNGTERSSRAGNIF